jgi:hypothetical protein
MSQFAVEGDYFSPPSISIEVGLPHPFWSFLPHEEGMRAIYQPSGINLIITLNSCSASDIRSFKDDGLKFGLLRMSGGYCWLLRTGFATLDAPYSPCLEAPEIQAGPWFDQPHTPNTRVAIHLHVIDRKGIARVRKMVSVSPDFTRKLEAIHASSLRADLTPGQWEREVNAYFRRYPDPRKAFQLAAVTSKGGA